MAKKHVGKDVVISLDIKDFFTSIKQTKLQTIFKGFGFEEKPARTLSELCTYKAFVPQGALTSPKLSNIVAALTFGPTIKAYCDREQLTLSIYADDITVSFTGVKSVAPIVEALTQLIQAEGFRVNNTKTKIMTRKHRQYVCGVVVNAKTNLIREERLRLRAMVHNVVKNGLPAEAAKNQMTAEKFAEVLRGKVNWLQQLNKPLGTKMMEKLTPAIKDYTETKRAEGGLTGPTPQPGEVLATGQPFTLQWTPVTAAMYEIDIESEKFEDEVSEDDSPF